MFILASKSPRRKELFPYICKEFSIISEDIDESSSLYLPIKEAVTDIARRKGEVVFASHPNDIVISADTIVVIENTIIGKPKDEDDAKRILRLLSNREHIVYTAYWIFCKNKIINNIVESHVFMNNLSDEHIEEYIKTGSPMDKAGAYGVQDSDKFNLINKINGSLNNVIGFPVEDIIKDLKENNLLK